MRVLFTSTSGWGHIHPMVPLARAFLDRGDDVLWATGDEVCGRLEREGIATAVAGLDDGVAMSMFYERYPQVSEVPPPERSDFMFPRLFGAVRAEAMLADLVPAARAYAPDLLVCDAAEFAGPIAAAMVSAPKHHTLVRGHAPSTAGRGNRSRGGAALGCARTRRPALRRCVRQPVPGHLPTEHAAGRPTAHPGRPSAAPRRVRDWEEEPLPNWISEPSSEPLVYVTLGTVFSNNDVLSTVIGALRELPVRVVVTVGPRGEPDALGTQPINVHVARYIPQTQLLEHCSLVVSHAGSGTFLAALGAGLPQLCLPQAADQFFNAAACAQAGAGIALTPDAFSTEAVSDAVGTLLTEAAYRDAASRVSREIAAMPSPTEVADKLHADHG